MKVLQKAIGKGRRGVQIFAAFFRLDYLDVVSYPLSFAMGRLTPFIQVFTFFFIARLVGTQGTDVGGDYYSYVIIGAAVARSLDAALGTFGGRIQSLISQGQFEMMLVEPVPWKALPFALISWTAGLEIGTSIAMVLVSLALGASFLLGGIPAALLIVSLGLASSLAVGILDAGIKVLSKRSNPILVIYTIAATILSGVYFPREALPAAIRWISWLLPHTYVIQAIRRELMPLGDSLPGPSTTASVLALVGFCVVAYPLGLWLYGRSMEYARKLGILSGY